MSTQRQRGGAVCAVFLCLALFVVLQSPAQAITWNTFLGSNDDDTGGGIAVDGSGNVYRAGSSYATWGSPIQAYTGGRDAFVAKFDAGGNLLWNTFMGSAKDDHGGGIAVDGSGNVYVVGTSYESWGNPISWYYYGETPPKPFVAKLDTDGNLLWNTFIAQWDAGSGGGIAVHESDNGSASVYVTGAEGYYDDEGGYWDVLVAKFDANGARLRKTTIHDKDKNYGSGIAVDGAGNVYVTGLSFVLTPMLANVFVAQLDANCHIVWNTSIGSGEDYGSSVGDIAVDGTGAVYVTGSSNGTWGSPIQPFIPGQNAERVFVAKLDTSGAMLWNTFMGSSHEDWGSGIAVDGSGNVYVAGSSRVSGSLIKHDPKGYDAYAAKFDAGGNLLGHAFMGAADSEDYGYNIAVDGSGNLYVSGISQATWGGPIRAYTGGFDAFVAKLPAELPNDTECPAAKLVGADTPVLEYLRDFRDSTLASRAPGRRIIQIYYGNAGSINAVLDSSPALRAIARKALEIIAPMCPSQSGVR